MKEPIHQKENEQRDPKGHNSSQIKVQKPYRADHSWVPTTPEIHHVCCVVEIAKHLIQVDLTGVHLLVFQAFVSF